MRPRKEVHMIVAFLSWVLFCLRFATIPVAVKAEGWRFLVERHPFEGSFLCVRKSS